MLEVATYAQHADDPSEFWPETLERMVAGELALTDVVDGRSRHSTIRCSDRSSRRPGGGPTRATRS